MTTHTKPESRIPLVPTDTADPDLKPVFDRIRASRGAEPLRLHRALALAPKLFLAFQGLAMSLRNECLVGRQHVELMILRACHNQGGGYEIQEHEPMALAAGLTRGQVDAIGDWRDHDIFDPAQKAILAYADALRDPAGVDAAVVAALSRHFSPREIVELTIAAGAYTAAAMLTNALDLRHEE